MCYLLQDINRKHALWQPACVDEVMRFLGLWLAIGRVHMQLFQNHFHHDHPPFGHQRIKKHWSKNHMVAVNRCLRICDPADPVATALLLA